MLVDAKRRPDVSGKVGGGGTEVGHFTLPIDANRMLDYNIAPGFYSMQVSVIGWYMKARNS